MISEPIQLASLKQEWESFLPLPTKRQALLWRKLRLEWNYHSNHIEGNTLTYGETELLLLHDRTTGNHHHREYMEMKAHDAGIGYIAALAADPDRLLAEADIRDLNKIILKEPFWKAAETPDGHPTRKEIIPGQYKTSPNNVRLANGEIFFFASVEDTPPGMQALADWLRGELESPTLHPVTLAAHLHHRFVMIHPFDDGNGRVARLLVNYVLMRSGYLPVIVRTGDKANYLTALQLADAGDLGPLTDYLEHLTEWSLRLGIKAAKGESIQEPSDIEKEVALFVQDQNARKTGNHQVTEEALQQLFDLSLKPLLIEIEAKLKQLNPLFLHPEVVRTIRQANGSTFNLITISDIAGIDPGYQVQLYFFFRSYKGGAPTPFDFALEVVTHFTAEGYTITNDREVMANHSYSHFISGDESARISASILAKAFASIKIRAAAGGSPPVEEV